MLELNHVLDAGFLVLWLDIVSNSTFIIYFGKLRQALLQALLV